ncbi:hypothetical protein K6119_15945 [Paracrocinitomix mangrovi]|uniref:hypothetical protein n=1 Tax=Paracrocinitomix mangrovi TaxID=2862509 RepID=UPI001C8DF1A0|nr:hypothetical protein [Paracrocinitomix mangrovi]UKN01222.1 hypothetical protein K6119_15945 [Paracrocinitomix mangrovi]
MKKYIALGFVASVLLIFSSFVGNDNDKSTEKTIIINNGDDNEEIVSSSDVWKFMRENVFSDLNKLVEYDEESRFSRCPSGFSQYMDEELSSNQLIYGTITYAQGCHRDDFCLYKIDWASKETFLKKNQTEEYVTVDTFVKQEKKKIARI